MRIALRLICGSLLALVVLGGGPPATAAATWDGRYSVYTPDSFSYQHTNYTCVGASVQMMLNMVNGTTRHSASAQLDYWRYGRNHGKYQPSNNGVDPIGWAAALMHFGAGDYKINLADRFKSGLRTLAAAMRATGRPVGLFVDAGGDAWVMTGFAATADPLLTTSFKVTAIQAMGPLYPDGTINGHPYDPGPGTWLTTVALRQKFTPMQWKQAPEWSGRWVAVVPD